MIINSSSNPLNYSYLPTSTIRIIFIASKHSFQDPYLKSDEYGQTIDEVENLIKKHEAFEKAAAAQEERFAALERLTTVSRAKEGGQKSIEIFFSFARNVGEG